MVRISGICGQCNKYYQGDRCPVCDVQVSGKTLNFIPDLPEYYDHGLGKRVKSRQHRRAEMKAQGLTEVGNEWNAIDPAKRRREQERKFEKQLQEINKQAYQMLGEPVWN